MNNKKILIGTLSGVVIIAVALLILMYGFSDNLSDKPSGEIEVGAQTLEENGRFPGELLGLPLVQYFEGEEAIANIGQLHGTNIATEEGYIANYQDQIKGQAITIWISVDPEDKARELFDIMDGKIKDNPNTPFKERTELEVNGLNVINVTGMGQDHYYWVQGQENIWVAVGGFEDSLETLNIIMETLN